MRKILGIMMLLIVVVATSGCSVEDEHAFVTVTTSEGKVSTYHAYDTALFDGPGQNVAIRYTETFILPEGGSVSYVFDCTVCGNKQSETITEPTGVNLYCDCEEEEKEFFCLNVEKLQEEE